MAGEQKPDGGSCADALQQVGGGKRLHALSCDTEVGKQLSDGSLCQRDIYCFIRPLCEPLEEIYNCYPNDLLLIIRILAHDYPAFRFDANRFSRFSERAIENIG